MVIVGFDVATVGIRADGGDRGRLFFGSLIGSAHIHHNERGQYPVGDDLAETSGGCSRGEKSNARWQRPSSRRVSETAPNALPPWALRGAFSAPGSGDLVKVHQFWVARVILLP